jgi:hypothetical protein
MLKSFDGNTMTLPVSAEMPIMRFYELAEQVSGIPKGQSTY